MRALVLALVLAFLGVASAVSAEASHILVKEEAKCESLKEDLLAGKMEFADAAKEFSTCPSGKKGGSLGKFGPGQMVKEFDAVVWKAPLNEVQGCTKTQFGYHLILVTSRD